MNGTQTPAADSRPSQIRKAYCFAPGAHRGQSRTPADEVERGVWQTAECWNAEIPRKRIRVLTQDRFRECEHTLRVWTADEICDGIRCYARQKWQRLNQAWKTFENWIVEGNATGWIEEALTASYARPLPAGPVKSLVDDAAERMTADENARLLQQFAEYSPEEQAELLGQASAECRSIRVLKRCRLEPSLNNSLVRAQLLVILKRRSETGGTPR